MVEFLAVLPLSGISPALEEASQRLAKSDGGSAFLK